MRGGLAAWQWAGIGGLLVAAVAIVPLVAFSRGKSPSPAPSSWSSPSSRPASTAVHAPSSSSPAAFDWAGTYEWTCVDDPSKPRLEQRNDAVTLTLRRSGARYEGTIRHGYGTWQGKPAEETRAVTADVDGPRARIVVHDRGAEILIGHVFEAFVTWDVCGPKQTDPITVTRR